MSADVNRHVNSALRSGWGGRAGCKGWRGRIRGQLLIRALKQWAGQRVGWHQRVEKSRPWSDPRRPPTSTGNRWFVCHEVFHIIIPLQLNPLIFPFNSHISQIYLVYDLILDTLWYWCLFFSFPEFLILFNGSCLPVCKMRAVITNDLQDRVSFVTWH